MLESLGKIDVLILAGGKGTRLQSALPDRPKVLAPVAGRPFLSYLMDQLVSTGFRQVILCTGYKGEQIREAFGDQYNGLDIQYSQEPEPLGTGGAIRYGLPLITTDSALVTNGDSYVNYNLTDFLAWHLKNDLQASLLLTYLSDTSRYGRVKADANGLITKFEEKGEKYGSGWVNAGIYIFNRDFLKSIPSGQFFSLEQEFFPGLIDKGLYGFRCEEEFIDIGTPESYALAEDFFSKLAL
ncbi:nucleotidyltransferase family protein [candidate division KSB1 bacterium]|nr:nucleotidyltransferase family protein [candidate division KSB1 bacterium]